MLGTKHKNATCKLAQNAGQKKIGNVSWMFVQLVFFFFSFAFAYFTSIIIILTIYYSYRRRKAK